MRLICRVLIFFQLIPKRNELYAIVRRASSVRRLSVCKHLCKSLVLPDKWLDRDQTHFFANLPSLSLFPFLPHTNPKWPRVCTVNSTIAHVVKQFVKLFVIQYGRTFCLSVRTLYEAPLHSLSRLSIRQLNLLSKCWNDLLCH